MFPIYLRSDDKYFAVISETHVMTVQLKPDACGVNYEYHSPFVIKNMLKAPEIFKPVSENEFMISKMRAEEMIFNILADAQSPVRTVPMVFEAMTVFAPTI